jgi:hypothetical protein
MLRIKLNSQSPATGLVAVMLMTMVATTFATAQTGLQAHLAVSSPPPGEITAYKLPSTTETSPGLTTLGVGQPAYPEAQIRPSWCHQGIDQQAGRFGGAITESPLGAGIPTLSPRMAP